MKIKRFFARDMRQALLQVKEELGAEAVIMSNKKVAGGVEIVAAIDGDGNQAAPRQMSNKALLPPNQPHSSGPTGERELKDDQVSLNQRGGMSAPSVSDRFASMLKNYRGGQESTSHQPQSAKPTDSLSALLERQSERSNSMSNAYQSSDRYQYTQDNRRDQQDTRDRAIEDRTTPYASSTRAYGQREESSRQSPNHFSSGQLSPERPSSNQPSSNHYSSGNKRDGKIGEELESMKEDMSSIRRLLEHQVSGLMWQEVERREPLRAMLIKRLERMGISPELADQLACYIPEDTPPQKAWKALLALVSDQVVVSKQDILRQGGIVALLGPTGVGKTTTVAKLAARAAMEYGSDNVALVTTDTYRIGAHEQLSIYGRIMGCPVRVAKDSEELADVLYQLRNRRLVLIDTAGMGQRDVRLSEQLDTLMQESGEIINSYLVLPATAQRQVLQETLDHFRRIPLSGCIMTKLDESLSLGEFISVVVQNALPVTYIANGQRVPEDIVIAQPKYMVAKANELLEKSTENEPHFWNSDMEGV
ncbi:flagellar biosynthesis protein FlhF [Vibrio methylphosphonaticus]|uniref:flagellar biosynthesis protein FlhF n=1 Tax=Vibrio methylphosphonaticus TaxID=2946866 RepID=UPI00202AB33A|nr:flagellar biosynthesis protein FlhF [Vibrio methylphosphonaticus]MCL9774508.1 flagellar biosynthesis protein FlhF [Vibrio methylphosphonaticus]